MPTATATPIPYSYLRVGSFVLGDRSVAAALTATTPLTMTWWGAQWYKLNKLSGGPATSAFIGFAATLNSEPPRCGGSWTTTPGNSPPPSSAVPPYMAVIVASTITTTGSTVSGNVVQIVVVKTARGYSPDPGHAGTGTIVQVICGHGAAPHDVLRARATAPAPMQARHHAPLRLEQATAAAGAAVRQRCRLPVPRAPGRRWPCGERG